MRKERKLNQDFVFAQSEGDNWFERNRRALEAFDAKADLPLRLIELYGLRPRKVLEVGAANGYRLAELAKAREIEGTAVEPSADAIAYGRAKFPGIKFIQSSAAKIPLEEKFDLIIVNFVFHWVDREKLLCSVAEVDRLLADGGFLIVGDFFPANFTKVRYHHLTEEEIYTYKQDYARIFLASGIYEGISFLAGGHGSKSLAADISEDDRIGVWLLKKTLTERYIEGSHPHSGERQ